MTNLHFLDHDFELLLTRQKSKVSSNHLVKSESVAREKVFIILFNL
jgi:hypothetical protein